MTDHPQNPEAISSPEVAAIVAADFLGGQKLEDGIGLCLSGGGFRAMLFHLGAFIRLNEVGLLAKLDRVASVSGGSIAAGALAVAWNSLTFDASGVVTNLLEEVAAPLLTLARKRIDATAIALGLLPFVHASRVASRAYDRFLFHGKTLQDLPASPRFSFTATSLQSGVLWRFSRDYAADWRVGLWPTPNLPIALAVGASAAFPPYLSPAYIDVPAGAITAQQSADLFREPYTRSLCLTDGGIYDNLGLEPFGNATRLFSLATAAPQRRLRRRPVQAGYPRRCEPPTSPFSKGSICEGAFYSDLNEPANDKRFIGASASR